MTLLRQWVFMLGALPLLLGVNERRYGPMWSTWNSPVDGYPHCIAFKAWQRNTGPVTLALPYFMHIGELVKPGNGGGWRSLDPGDILAGQLFFACRCGDVYVLTWPQDGGALAERCQEEMS